MMELIVARSDGAKRIPGRRRLVSAVVITCLLSLVGCAEEPPTLESIGLSITTDLEAGTTFEVAFPVQEDTELQVLSAPPGITASIGMGRGAAMRLLRVVIDRDTPRGEYNLGISVVRGGTETVLGWPFEVVDGLNP